jgi:hypothetical protein
MRTESRDLFPKIRFGSVARQRGVKAGGEVLPAADDDEFIRLLIAC